MTLVQCSDLSPARWLVEQSQGDDWARLAARGPKGYPAYSRLRFVPDPSYNGQSTNEVDFNEGHDGPPPVEAELIGFVLAELAGHTDTPDACYFCVWDGWSTIKADRAMPKVEIPNRDYFLFHGTTSDIEYWEKCNARGALRDAGRYGEMPDPAFVWPADRAWCIANDVDPHYATIGASIEAIEQLLADPRIDTVADDPQVEPPYWA
ncbi:hypothetical protein GTV32_18400 [Gordonia sp. SID5947]|nr:hypothetical protein [Gordonia sp. SID5947]